MKQYEDLKVSPGMLILAGWGWVTHRIETKFVWLIQKLLQNQSACLEIDFTCWDFSAEIITGIHQPWFNINTKTNCRSSCSLNLFFSFSKLRKVSFFSADRVPALATAVLLISGEITSDTIDSSYFYGKTQVTTQAEIITLFPFNVMCISKYV